MYREKGLQSQRPLIHQCIYQVATEVRTGPGMPSWSCASVQDPHLGHFLLFSQAQFHRVDSEVGIAMDTNQHLCGVTSDLTVTYSSRCRVKFSLFPAPTNTHTGKCRCQFSSAPVSYLMQTNKCYSPAQAPPQTQFSCIPFGMGASQGPPSALVLCMPASAVA